MAAIFQLPKTGGTISAGYTLSFFAAGTTTPLSVYSDDGLSSAILQPIEADAAGRFPQIYVPTGTFKVTLKDDDGASIYTADNCDSGIPAGGGALAVEDGGTGADTAAGARTELGAASQTDLDAVAADLAAIQGQITGGGGTLGDLAFKDTVARTDLAAGFGVVTLKHQEIDSDNALITCSGTIPNDNSIPQITEGTEALSGNFTPASASSILFIEVSMAVGAATGDQDVCIALFQNTSVDAIAARWGTPGDGAGASHAVHFVHRMASPGTSAITFSVRVGAGSGNSYVNGLTSTRLGGGSQYATLRVREELQI